jgi:hypothetical protein
MVAEPVTPVAEAVHVLATDAAVKTSACEVFTFVTLLELVTVPPAAVP